MKKTINILAVNYKPENGFILEEILVSQPQYVLTSASTMEEVLVKMIEYSPDIILIL